MITVDSDHSPQKQDNSSISDASVSFPPHCLPIGDTCVIPREKEKRGKEKPCVKSFLLQTRDA